MNIRVNFSVSLITILFSFIFLIVSYQFPNSEDNIGADGWPKLILYCTLLIGLILFIRSIRNYLKYKKVSENDQTKDVGVKSNDENQIYRSRYWINIGLIIFYILAINYIGFIVTTFIFLIVGLRLNGFRNKIHNLLISILGSCFFILIFINLLNIPFPRGLGIFDRLSYFIY